MSQDYTAIDAAILKAVKEGKNHFYKIHSALAAQDLPGIDRDRGARVVERRLQSLRRRDLLIYQGQGKCAGWKEVIKA